MAEITSDESEHMPEKSEPDPEHIMQVATGFWGTKVLGAAVDLELFTVLADGGLRASEIERELDLHPRATRDFLDTLASLGFLERDGDGDDPRYRNTPETAAFLNKDDPRYIGGAINIFNQQTYDVWGGLEESLRTGEPQGVIDETGEPLWEEMYDDPMELEAFAEGMAGLSKGNFVAFAEQFDFSDYDSMTDVGGGIDDEVCRKFLRLSVHGLHTNTGHCRLRIVEKVVGELAILPHVDTINCSNVLADDVLAQRPGCEVYRQAVGPGSRPPCRI